MYANDYTEEAAEALSAEGKPILGSRFRCLD